MKSIMTLGIFLATLCSCKKETIFSPPPGDPNNKFSAMIAENGTAPTSLIVNGNNTSFAKRTDPNGDIVINVLGSNGKSAGDHRSIQITLVNITSVGTYLFDASQTKIASFCDYTVGSVFFSPIFELYSTRNMNPGGSITIEELSATAIKGNFNANCNNYAMITNGTFQGSFMK